MDAYDSFLPIVELANFADEARKMSGYRWFYCGFGIIGLGLLHKWLMNVWTIVRKQEKAGDLDFLTPAVVAACLFALLIGYKPFCSLTIWMVSHLGDTGGHHDQVVTTFALRANAFYQWREAHSGGWFKINPLGLAMELLTALLYLLVEGWVVFLRAAQTYTLACIITFGPLLLGVSGLGGPLVTIGIGWFWAMVEVSAWSVTMDILLVAYGKSGLNSVPQDFVVAREFVYAFVMFFLLVSVAGITSMLVRGTSGAMMASGFSDAPGTLSMMMTSRPMTHVNKQLYGHARTGVQSAGARIQRWRSGDAPKTTPKQAWKSADAIQQRRENRSAGTGGGSQS